MQRRGAVDRISLTTSDYALLSFCNFSHVRLIVFFSATEVVSLLTSFYSIIVQLKTRNI